MITAKNYRSPYYLKCETDSVSFREDDSVFVEESTFESQVMSMDESAFIIRDAETETHGVQGTKIMIVLSC